MTKKHFELVAAILYRNHTFSNNPCKACDIAREFADELRNINPRFNRYKFLAASGVTPEKHVDLTNILGRVNNVQDLR